MFHFFETKRKILELKLKDLKLIKKNWQATVSCNLKIWQVVVTNRSWQAVVIYI